MEQSSELDLPESYWESFTDTRETVVVAPPTGGHTDRGHGLDAGVGDARPGRDPFRAERAERDAGKREEGPGAAGAGRSGAETGVEGATRHHLAEGADGRADHDRRRAGRTARRRHLPDPPGRPQERHENCQGGGYPHSRSRRAADPAQPSGPGVGLALRVSPGQGDSTAKRRGRPAWRSTIRASATPPAATTAPGCGSSGWTSALLTATATATGCPQPQPVPGDNDTKAGTLTADVDMPAMYALTAARRVGGRPRVHLARPFGTVERRRPVRRLQLGLRAARAARAGW